MTCIRESHPPDNHCCYTDVMAQAAICEVVQDSSTIHFTCVLGLFTADVIAVGPDALPDEAGAGFNIKLWENGL
jgi:hypothetical protein